MRALHFILDTLITLYAATFLLRLIMQLVRADFRNPFAQAIVQVTNPVVVPLRRLLPAAGRIDTACVLAIVALTALEIWILSLVIGIAPGVGLLLRLTLLALIALVLNTYLFAIVVYAILSFVAAGSYSPAYALLASICEPVLRPFRRVIPPIGGIDLSPLWALIAIQALLLLLH